MNLPPGLGLDSPTVEQAKAKNPRRKAKKKKLSRPLSDALPENGVTAAAEQASSSSSRAAVIEPATSSLASVNKLKLNPATEQLLAQLTAGFNSSAQSLPVSSGRLDPRHSNQEAPLPQSEGTPNEEKRNKQPSSDGNRRARRQRRAATPMATATVALTEMDPHERSGFDQDPSPEPVYNGAAIFASAAEQPSVESSIKARRRSRAAASPASPAVTLTEPDPIDMAGFEPISSPGTANGGSASTATPTGAWPSSEPAAVTPTGAWPVAELADDSAAQPRTRGNRTQRRPHYPSRGSSSQAVPPSGDPDAHPVTGYCPHWEGRRLQQALKRGQVLQCEFRVNAGDRRQGYAGLAGLAADIQIQGLENQNRAVPGDLVAIQILPQSQWLTQRVNIMSAVKKLQPGSADNPKMEALEQMLKDMAMAPPRADCDKALAGATSPEEAHKILNDELVERADLRATGRVVAVLEPSPRRNQVVGVLQQAGPGCVLLPVDPRMPKGRVRISHLPATMRAELQAVDQTPETQTLVSAVMGTWPESAFQPEMEVRESLGQAGEIEVETKAILQMEGVDTEEFDADVLGCLPHTPWSISEEEIAKRRDLRSVRLFSIDPPTARDLDDALSIEDLGDGQFRIGVHIADVSHFTPPGSALDAKAAQRATSVYLTQRVIPMLPPLLCEELCSLNPGVDRLSFSVIWEMDAHGKVLSQWTGRTVIRSCAKLAYPHAQAMIDGSYAAREGEEPPVLLEAPHTWPQVVGDILALNRIARKLHHRRFENGALRLDNVKLSFKLDGDGNPSTTQIYEQKEANELVAEFMLLANMSVAQLIGMAFPDKAMLRRHPSPEDRKMGELEAAAQKLGYDIDCTTAGTIQESLRRLRRSGEDPVIMDILQLMATKPMKQAQYFSTGTYMEIGDWRHYALAVPMYTHFTSPIRRYPDVIVHRLLARLLAQDPRAATQAFCPNPIGTLEHDKAEGKCQLRQQAAAAVLDELAAEGEDAEAVDREPAPGPTDLASPPGDPAALSSLAHAVGSQKPAEASEQGMELGASVEDGDDTNLLAAAETSDFQTSQPGADDGEVSSPDASMTVAVTDRQPTAETPSGTGPAEVQVVDDEESSDGSQPAGLRMEASSSGTDAEEAPSQSSQALSLPEPSQPDAGRGAADGERHQIKDAEDGRPQPRLIARKVRGEKGRGTPKSASVGLTRDAIPVSKELLECKDLEKVADHCNKRKTAAKACSEASSKLYLCVLLRAQPMILDAVVTVVNGSRFFDLYVPQLGIEARIQVLEVLPAVEALWEPQARCITLIERPSREGQGEVAEADGGPPCLAAISNSHKLQNRYSLQPLSLPLEIRAFAKLPVVVCAKSPGNAKPLASYALPYLRASSSHSLPVQGAAVSIATTAVDAEELE